MRISRSMVLFLFSEPATSSSSSVAAAAARMTTCFQRVYNVWCHTHHYKIISHVLTCAIARSHRNTRCVYWPRVFPVRITTIVKRNNNRSRMSRRDHHRNWTVLMKTPPSRRPKTTTKRVAYSGHPLTPTTVYWPPRMARRWSVYGVKSP